MSKRRLVAAIGLLSAVVLPMKFENPKQQEEKI